MRSFILAIAILLPSASFAAEATEVRAGDHSCDELKQIIRQGKPVFIRVGIGGFSFRAPPAQCNLGDKRATTAVRDATGQICVLDYSCVYDPQSFYNRFPD